MSKKVELFRLCKFVGLEFALNPTMGKISRPFFICLLLLSGFSAEASAPLCLNVFKNRLVEVAMPGRPSGSEQPPRLPFSKDIFPENTGSRVFVELAVRGMLLQQKSQELSEKGLIKPNGGLCATSCVANLLGSMMAQEQSFFNFPTVAPHLAELMVTGYNAYTGRDARMGAVVQDMVTVIGLSDSVLKEAVGYRNEFHDMVLSARNIRDEFYPYRIDQALRGDSIGIASVRPVNRAEGTVGHGIVILKVDLENRLFYISDPNKPNFIVKTPFRYTDGTNVVFRVPYTYGDIDVSMFGLSVITRHIHEHN